MLGEFEWVGKRRLDSQEGWVVCIGLCKLADMIEAAIDRHQRLDGR